MHKDVPFRVDLSLYVLVVKIQEVIHEQMLIWTESHKIKEKKSSSVLTLEKNQLNSCIILHIS